MTEQIGRILLIDDKLDEVIEGAIVALARAGMSVQFWDAKGNFPSTISNIRVVIADIDVSAVGIKTKTAAYYSPFFEVLRLVPGPYFAIIMAQEYEEGDPALIREFYSQLYPTSPLCGVILDKGLRKDEELEDFTKIVKIIADSIKDHDILRLLLAWEAVIDKAQDKALSEIISQEVENTIFHLIKSLCRDFGEESASREFVDATTQLISRRVHETLEFKDLEKVVRELNAQELDNKGYPKDEDLLLYNRLMYFKPKDGEPIWTGDIYRTKGLSECEEYAIVLTPVCDLVNTEKSKVLTCLGFPLDEKEFSNPKHPLYQLDPKAAKKLENVKGDASKLSYLNKKYLECEGDIPDNFYLLWNFIDGGALTCICFDFNNVMTTTDEASKKYGWQRVLRLDWPFIQQVQEKYGAYVSRVGVPEFNLSREKLREKLS